MTIRRLSPWMALLALSCLGIAPGSIAVAAAAGAADKTAEEGEKKKEEAKPQAVEPEITVSPGGVTVHAVNVYASLLFVRLAERTGLRVVVDDAIKDRKVTCHLADKSPQEVVNYIVAAYGFSSRVVTGIIMVSEGIPRRPSSYLLSDIESIPTQYVEANNAKSLLPVFLQDHVKVNDEQNAVVLAAPSDVLQKFREDIQQFDIPAAQIMLEILVVEFTDFDTAERDLGLRWDNAGRGVEFGTLSLPQGNQYLPARGMGELVIRGVADLPTAFHARLESLVSARRARVRASPRIATVSGRWANFFVGVQRYLRQPIEMPPQQGMGDQEGMHMGTQMTNYIDAGVRLNIAPWTGDGQEIICEIRPEVSTLSPPDPVTGLPEKSTRSASTMVRVSDGQTVIIGGMRLEEARLVTSKVPLLGDLPLLGRLFRSKSNVASRTDLVIFITPKVLSQTGHLSPEEERQLHDRFLKDQTVGITPRPAE